MSSIKETIDFGKALASGDNNGAGQMAGEKLAQATIVAATEGVGRIVAGGEGIVYLRTDKSIGGLKPYAGQAKSEARFIARQSEHARANPKADFDFKKIDKGRPGKHLDAKEQKAIDALGGPTNKSNPNGGASNKKNVIKKD